MKAADGVGRIGFVIVIACIGTSLFVCLLYANFFWSTRSDVQKALQKREQLLRKTDYHALLAACRQLSDRVSKGQLEPGQHSAHIDPDVISRFPRLILALEPTGIEIGENGRVLVELHGGLLHFGVMAYPEDFEPPGGAYEYGDRELIPGLWFYHDDYQNSPELQKDIERLIDKGSTGPDADVPREN
jgi:hypothetical protein